MKKEDFMQQKACDMSATELASALKIKLKSMGVSLTEKKKTLSDKLSKCGCCESGNRKAIKESLKEFIDEICPSFDKPAITEKAKEIFGKELVE